MTTACRLTGVSKRLGGQWALRDVSLSVSAAEVVGLVGPNGAGKTTLLRIVARLITKYSGAVEIPPGDNGSIRYFAGERTLPPNVRVRTWRRLWSLEPEQRARKRIGALSRGMRQRLGLETVLAQPKSAAVVLLDEPWEGLDPDATAWLSARLVDIRAFGGAILVSSHRIHELAAVCDRCVFLNGGHITREVDVHSSIVANRSMMLFDAFEHSKSRGK